VEDKSNEITAIPALLDEIDITEAVVSIDAIGCQRTIVQRIREKKGHYLLALKENQGNLYEDAVYGFKTNQAQSVSEEWEYGHGRYETRRCSILPAGKVLLPEHPDRWTDLQTIIKVESSRQMNGRQTNETRYYISDETDLPAGYFNALVRGHWGIENHLHWHLDVTFKEDASRARNGYAAENLSSLRKIALQIIYDQQDKLSLKKRRLKAAYDLNYLKQLLRT
jgi:predicted transposase YbfD/YdcC